MSSGNRVQFLMPTAKLQKRSMVFTASSVNKLFPQTEQLGSLLKPILLSMKISGIYFGDGDSGILRRLWSWYSLLLTFTSYLYLLSSAAPIVVFLQQLSFDEVVISVMPTVWVFQNCFNYSIHCYSCTKGAFYPGLFQCWQNLILSEQEREQLSSYVRKTTIRVTSVCLGLAIFYVIAWTTLLLGWIPGLHLNPYPATRFFSPAVAEMHLLFTVIFGNVTMFCWFLSCGIIVLLCLTTSRMFEQLNNQILSDVTRMEEEEEMGTGHRSEGDGDDQLSVVDFRDRHHRIMAMVECIDEHLGLFLLAEYTNYMALLCVDAYKMLLVRSDGLTKSVDMSWSVVIAGILAVQTYAASIVNIAAHASYEHLNCVNGENLSVRNLIQLSLMVTRVGGPDMGVSVFGFFVITKGFMLTLLSAFITYFFLLLQFNSAPTDDSDNCCFSNSSFEHLLSNLTCTSN